MERGKGRDLNLRPKARSRSQPSTKAVLRPMQGIRPMHDLLRPTHGLLRPTHGGLNLRPTRGLPSTNTRPVSTNARRPQSLTNARPTLTNARLPSTNARPTSTNARPTFDQRMVYFNQRKAYFDQRKEASTFDQRKVEASTFDHCRPTGGNFYRDSIRHRSRRVVVENLPQVPLRRRRDSLPPLRLPSPVTNGRGFNPRPSLFKYSPTLFFLPLFLLPIPCFSSFLIHPSKVPIF